MPHGRLYGMRIKMDHSGRVVFPKPLRRSLGLASGGELEAVAQAGGVLLRPVAQKPAMVEVDGLWVHQGKAEPGADWDRLLNDVREDRTQRVLEL